MPNPADNLDALAADLCDPDPEVRRIAANRLRDLDDEQAGTPLVRALEDESPHVRAAAALGLLYRQPASATPALIKHLLNDPKGNVRAICATALASADDEAMQALMQALADPDWDVRVSACCALGRVRYRPAIEPLMKMLDDPSWQVRHAACEALVEMGVGDSRVVDAADHLCEDPEAQAFEKSMSAVAAFLNALIDEPSLAECIEEFDGRQIEGKRSKLREAAESARELLKGERFPETDFSLERLADRARRLLAEAR